MPTTGPDVVTVKKVHCLHEGRPLCGFSSNVPAGWPPGHMWISLEVWGPARETYEQLAAFRLLNGARLCLLCNDAVREVRKTRRT